MAKKPSRDFRRSNSSCFTENRLAIRSTLFQQFSSSSSAFDESSSFNLFIGDRKHEASIKER
jgi:hypothetical protein